MPVASESGGPDLPAPAFIEPASGMLTLGSTRHTDVVLQVADIDPARTKLLVDGVSLGDLDGRDAFGTLTLDELTLRLRGAMVPGSHRLVLQTTTTDALLSSAEIAIQIADSDAPRVEADPGEPQLAAREIAGFSRDTLLALDDSTPDDPRLTVVRMGAEDWDFAGAVTIRVPGYDRGDFERGLAIAADVSEERLRVAWRQGAPGRSIAFIDAPWDGADLDTAARIGIEPTPEITGPVEYVELSRPVIVGDTLLVEMLAAVDVELPHPGDRAVLRARFSEDGGLGPVTRVGFGTLVDLDQLGPAIDLAHAEVGGAPLLSMRMDQRRPVVVEVDPDGPLRIRPARDDVEARTFVFTNTPLQTVVGGFGSRTVAAAAIQADGRMRIGRSSDLVGGEAEELTLTGNELPSIDGLTGDPVASTLGGAAIVLLPYGPGTEVHAIFATDAEASVVPLVDLYCSSLAVPAGPPGGQEAPLPVGCQLGADVYDAHVTLVPLE